jgi:hypothetical protein
MFIAREQIDDSAPLGARRMVVHCAPNGACKFLVRAEAINISTPNGVEHRSLGVGITPKS